TGAVKGVVSRNAEPLADMRVVFTNPNNGKQYKTKTAANGEYFSAGMALETFKVEVLGANGEVLYTNTVTLRSTGGSGTLTIHVGNPSASGGMAGGAGEGPQKKTTGEEDE